jgi:hypothetical protein
MNIRWVAACELDTTDRQIASRSINRENYCPSEDQQECIVRVGWANREYNSVEAHPSSISPTIHHPFETTNKQRFSFK